MKEIDDDDSLMTTNSDESYCFPIVKLFVLMYFVYDNDERKIRKKMYIFGWYNDECAKEIN